VNASPAGCLCNKANSSSQPSLLEVNPKTRELTLDHTSAACSLVCIWPAFGLHVYLLAPASNHDPFQLVRCLALHPLHHCHLGTPHHLTADLLFVRIPKTAAR